MEPGVLGLRTRPACLSKGMMSSKLRQHNMTRDMTFNIPCSAGADSRFQKMVSCELGLLWWYWGVQDEVSGLLSDPGLCGGGRFTAAVARVSLLAASLIGIAQ